MEEEPNMRKQIGKIQAISFGMGGYQDAMIGISVTLGSNKDCWGVGDFKGAFGRERSEYAKWTEEDRIKQLGEMVMWAHKLMQQANVENLNDLVDKPVEVTFDGNRLKSWRILTEVI